MKKYVSYEPDIKGAYSEEEFLSLYEDMVDKTEYPDFDGWKWDMLRSGVFENIR